MKGASSKSGALLGSILLPLILAQFICSYAGSNMNVAVTAIADDLGTDVHGVQIAITLFTLTMAALMIPGSKLTDIWGRKFCFRLGLIIYGLGALLGALSPGIGVLYIGYSFMEGIGSALLIPPVYILATVSFAGVESRAKAFGGISAAGGIGAAAGPLVGGFLTTAISWRASFILQAIVVLSIILLARRIADPGVQGIKPRLDILGAILSGAGLFFLVVGILSSGTYGWFTSNQDLSIGNIVIIPEGGISPVWLLMAIGGIILGAFFLHIRSMERKGKAPLLSTHIFRNKTSNLGLVTQLVQWMVLQGAFFVISVFFQTVRGFNAVSAGLIVTPATIGILLTGTRARKMAARFSQRALIRAGFILTTAGMALVILLPRALSSADTASVWSFVPGLFMMGLGIGTMLTSSVNVVQSAFPEKDQGEISGLSRSVSNLGSSFGTAVVGSVLVTTILPQTQTFGLALIVIIMASLVGLLAAFLLPSDRAEGSGKKTEVGEDAA
ncbi:MAG: MFS transporter [Methanomassiliicoccus sp.]|nr:MFS transporter [Methanomassiliicoccus sp.]